MKNLNFFYAALIAATIISCSKADDGVSKPETGDLQMTISAYGDGSRTSIGNGSTETPGIVSWSVGDEISLHKDSDGSAVKFTTDITEISESADFVGDKFENTEQYYALYPYDSETTADYDAETLTFTIGETQNYTLKNFAQGAFKSVAKTSNLSDVTFTNLMGGLKIELKGDGVITSIEVTTDDDTSFPICGTATVDMSLDTPEITSFTNGGTKVTLDCGEGVQLDETAPSTFMIALPPTTRDLHLKIIRKDGSYSTAKTISWNVVRNGIKYTALKWNTSDLAFTEPTTGVLPTAGTEVAPAATTLADIVMFAQNKGVGTTGIALTDADGTGGYYSFEAILTTNSVYFNSLHQFISLQTEGATEPNNGLFLKNFVKTDIYDTTNKKAKIAFGDRVKVVVPSDATITKDDNGAYILSVVPVANMTKTEAQPATAISAIDISTLITSDYPDLSAYQGMYVKVKDATVETAGTWNPLVVHNYTPITVGEGKTSIYTKNSSSFKGKSYNATTSDVSGVVLLYNDTATTTGKSHIAPQSKNDLGTIAGW